MKLDKFDIAILNTLQKNGRISNRELADNIGLSSAPCWRRLQALESKGYVNKYTAELNPKLLGFDIFAITYVSLENQHPDSSTEFEQAIDLLPQVLECFMTSGEYDYMLKIITPDISAYHEFISNNLLQITTVRSVNTTFILKIKKQTSSLPLLRK